MKARMTVTISCDAHGITDDVEIQLDKFTDKETLYAAFLGVGAPIVDVVALRFTNNQFGQLPDGWRD